MRTSLLCSRCENSLRPNHEMKFLARAFRIQRKMVFHLRHDSALLLGSWGGRGEEEEEEEDFMYVQGILLEMLRGLDTHTPGACRCIASCNEKRQRRHARRDLHWHVVTVSHRCHPPPPPRTTTQIWTSLSDRTTDPSMVHFEILN